MLRLNLGCGRYTLEGFVNLDAQNGWRFEHGLDFPDRSVDGITISHALMYVPETEWPSVFFDLARVLQTGGVLRVTEDATDDPLSERHGGHPDAVTLTTRGKVRDYMRTAGLKSYDMPVAESKFRDTSLCQNLHGGEPKVFFVEGVK